jgi:hypothetical protein
VAKTKLGLLQQAARQGLDETREMHSDAPDYLLDGIVRSAGNAQILLNGSGKGRFNLHRC